ncbi:MAG: glutathione S-transferase family protein [Alphaproteobacteria bacterium]
MAKRELYFISGSPPCWSVMLALAVKGLDYTPRRLSNTAGDQKSPEFLKINPRGHVPVLVEGKNVVPETLAVLTYLDLAHRNPPLFGTNPAERALVWQTISECDGHLRGPVGNISRPLFRNKAAEFEEQIAEAVGKVRDELALLEARLSGSEWLAGGTISAANLIIFPVLMQLTRAAGQENAASLDLAITPLDAHYPALAAWQARIEALPRYDDAYPPHWKAQAA